MSTWTCSPRILMAALTGAVLLTTSVEIEGAVPDGIAPDLTPVLPTSLPVLDASVVISGPRGYCVDPLGSLAETGTAFVLLASCAQVTGLPNAPAPDVAGLLTASVDGSDSDRPVPSAAELARFFASPAGLALLSRSGDPDALSVRASYARDGALFLHVLDSDETPPMGGHSWRAVFAVNGRLVTATLRDLAGHPISSVEGFRTVETFVDRILAASGTDE